MGLGDLYEEEAAVAFRSSNFSKSEIKEAREMLDDPGVSAQARQDMLYMLANHGELSPNEIDKYAKQVGADAEDVKEGGEAPLENAANARKSLSKAKTQKIDDAKEKLEQGGFGNSDEIIDQAKSIVKLFEDYHPRYEQAKSLDGVGGGGDGEPNYVESDLSQEKGEGNGQYSHQGGSPDQIRAGLNEFRGIDFGAFEKDASMLESAGSAVAGAKEGLNKSWQDGTSDWTGDAKQAAQGANKGINDNADKLAKALGTAPENIRTVSDDNKTNVVEYAKAVLNLYGDGTISGLTQTDVDGLIKAHQEFPGALRELEAKIEEIENKGLLDHVVDFVKSPFMALVGIVSPIAAILGYTFANEITEDNIHEEYEKMKGAQKETTKKLNDFVSAYDKKAQSFHEQGQNAGSAIQKNYDTLIQHLGKEIGDAFAAQGGKGGGDKGGGTQTIPGGAGDQQTGSGGGANVPPPPGGGGGSVPLTGAGAADAAGGGTTAPQGAGGGDAAGGGPGAGGAGPDLANGPKPGGQGDVENPVTGEKAEVDPETGEPYPIDPETGEAVKDGPERETLSVEQGDRKLDLVAPNEKGEMEISVADGEGPGKDFKLDFGNDSGDGNGPGAGDEASGGAQPSGQTGGGPGQAEGAQNFGPEGSAGDGSKGEQVYTPDEDGKIRIEENGLKITAEQPDGPDGPTTVTVDDGKGEPTTYTLGEENSESTGSSAAGGNGMRASGAGMAGGPDGDGPLRATGGAAPASDAGMSAAGMAGPDMGDTAMGGGVPDPGTSGVQSGDLGGDMASAAAQAGPAAAAAGDAGALQGDISGAAGAGDSGAMQGDLGGGPMASTGGDLPADAPVSAASEAESSEAESSGPAEQASDSTAPAANDATSPAQAMPSDALGGGGDPTGDSSLADTPGTDQEQERQGNDGGLGGVGSAAAGGGGGMMGGGMGAAGGGGGGGDDQDRQSQFVLDAVSELFDATPSNERISGALGDDSQSVLPFTR